MTSRALEPTASFPARKALAATACSNPPEGCARWRLELLAGELVKLTRHDNISRETLRRRLAETSASLAQGHVVHPQVDGEFVARIEDMLELYLKSLMRSARWCVFQERPTQLIGEVRHPTSAFPSPHTGSPSPLA